MRIYLDHAATTPCDPEVAQVMFPFYYENFGNASSLYKEGRQANAALEQARLSVAKLLGAQASEIIFTSGGTESDNMAIKGVAWAHQDKGRHIITTPIEHHAVLAACEWLDKQGFEITCVPVDKYGVVDPEEIRKALRKDTILVSVMHANNEVGTVQPIEEIGAIVKEHGALFHVDAVQTAGHLPINVDQMQVDLLSVSAHKLYGPKGIGALYIRKGVTIAPLLHGGGQEQRLRASTENIAAIVGFGRAVEMTQERMVDEAKNQEYLRDLLLSKLQQKISDVYLNGHPEKRLPGNVNVTISYVEGEAMVLALDAVGISCSTGSACSAANLSPSHVLMAIGLTHEQAHASLRLTLGRSTTEEDIETTVDQLSKIVERLREMSPLVN